MNVSELKFYLSLKKRPFPSKIMEFFPKYYDIIEEGVTSACFVLNSLRIAVNSAVLTDIDTIRSSPPVSIHRDGEPAVRFICSSTEDCSRVHIFVASF